MGPSEATKSPRPSDLTALPDPVMIVEIGDEHPTIAEVNSEFEAVFGYTQADVAGERPHRRIGGVESDFDVESIITDVVAGEPHKDTISLLVGADEQEFLFRATPHTENSSQAILTYLDVATFRDRQERLKERIAELERQKSTLTHDLRNAVAIVKAEVAKLEYKTKTNPEGDVVVPSSECQTILEEVSEATDRMEDMIDTELSDAGGDVVDCDELQTEWYSINHLVEESWNLITDKGSTVVVEDDFMVKCNQERVFRLFENLFRNAIDHNDLPVNISVGEHDTISTSTRGGGNVGDAFVVEDNGGGIPDEVVDTLFERGETTDGTGEGLSIVRLIAEQHGWSVRVRNKHGTGGAKFIITDVEMKRER
jgi:signal transduction histidine kinase